MEESGLSAPLLCLGPSSPHGSFEEAEDMSSPGLLPSRSVMALTPAASTLPYQDNRIPQGLDLRVTAPGNLDPSS